MIEPVASGRFRHQLALALAYERFERFGLGAAKIFDRIGHREPGGLRVEAGRAERLPARGQMFERVRIETSRLRLAAPLPVGTFFVTYLLAENAPERRAHVLQPNDAPS